MIPKIRACCRLFVKRKCGLLFLFFIFSCLCLYACFWSGEFKDGYIGNKASTAFIMPRFQEVDTGGNGIVFAWQMGSLSLYRNGGLFFVLFLTYSRQQSIFVNTWLRMLAMCDV